MKSTLKIKGKSYSIVGKTCHRNSRKEYQLDGKTFYEKWGKKIPKGTGYEIEVLNNEKIQSWHKNQNKLLNEKNELVGLHIYFGNDKKPYVCYPLQIKTKEKTIQLFNEWARIMFAQIFFGLRDSFLYENTNSGDTTVWANFIDEYLSKKGLKIEDCVL